jgi:hypothetical protein
MKAYKTLTALFLLGVIQQSEGKQSQPALAQQQAFLQDNEILINIDLEDYKAGLASDETLTEIVLDLNIENLVIAPSSCCSADDTCSEPQPPCESNNNGQLVIPPLPKSQVPKTPVSRPIVPLVDIPNTLSPTHSTQTHTSVSNGVTSDVVQYTTRFHEPIETVKTRTVTDSSGVTSI